MAKLIKGKKSKKAKIKELIGLFIFTNFEFLADEIAEDMIKAGYNVEDLDGDVEDVLSSVFGI